VTLANDATSGFNQPPFYQNHIWHFCHISNGISRKLFIHATLLKAAIDNVNETLTFQK